jgi:hypothetical protein
MVPGTSEIPFRKLQIVSSHRTTRTYMKTSIGNLEPFLLSFHECNSAPNDEFAKIPFRLDNDSKSKH